MQRRTRYPARPRDLVGQMLLDHAPDNAPGRTAQTKPRLELLGPSGNGYQARIVARNENRAFAPRRQLQKLIDERLFVIARVRASEMSTHEARMACDLSFAVTDPEHRHIALTERACDRQSCFRTTRNEGWNHGEAHP